jgi:hypothetical protein
MRELSTSTQRARVTRTALAAVVLMTVTAVGNAQVPGGTILRSGLHTFPQRHAARVTVVDLGESPLGARVVIELRNASDQVVAQTIGRARAGQPVQLVLPISDVLTQLRATVTIGPSFAGSRPSTTFEDVDADSLTVIPKVVCGPPSGRDSPQAFCPGWDVTSFLPL